MPELPDVEVFGRYIQSTSMKKKIEDVEVKDDRILEGIEESDLERIKGEEFTDTRRVGKHLFLEAGKNWIILHFGMTGYVEYYKETEPDYVKVRFGFENGYNLAYICTRLLGKVAMTDEPQKYLDQNGVGDDIMNLDKDEFIDRLSSKRGQIKSALMDQSLMSGLGNIYSDEVLFQLGIHPKTRMGDLEKGDIERIRDTMAEVVERSIEAGADPEDMPDDFLIPIREEGQTCPKDGGKIGMIKVNNRSTYYCTKHQKEK